MTEPRRLKRTITDLYSDTRPQPYGTRRGTIPDTGKRRSNRYKPFTDVVIATAARTPYGRFGGSLRDFTATELGALAIQEVLDRTAGKVTPDEVDYVFMGQVLPAGCGQVPARQSAILAGIPDTVPAITVNKVCASGIKPIDLACQMIQLGRADICIAGGMESMSNCPYALPGMRWGTRMGLPSTPCLDLMVNDGLWNIFYDRHMAIDGSVVADEFGIPRVEQDEWAYHTQMRARAAQEEGRLKDEIFPLAGKGRNSGTVIDTDEGPRPDTTQDILAGLEPVFRHRSPVTGIPGSVTPGNAPGINDGADACLIMSREAARERGLVPLCTIVDYAEISQPPQDIATVPGLAIRKVLRQNDLTLDEMTLIEINEAFAAVVLVSAREILDMSEKDLFNKVNVNGSAIAYGHPIGATGARIVMTLAYELKRRGGGSGVCGICSGLAQGDAMIVTVDTER